MTDRSIPSSPLGEIFGIVAICFGTFIFRSAGYVVEQPQTHVTFSDAGMVHLILMEAFLAMGAVWVLRLRRYPLERLKPQPTRLDSLLGLCVFVAAELVGMGIVNAFPHAEYERQPIVAMTEGVHLSGVLVLVTSIVNGLYEETFLMGYLVDAFRPSGASFALGVSLLVRMSYHLYQGPIGVVSVLGFGVVVGLFYLRTGRLWPVVLAHMLADAFALASLS